MINPSERPGKRRKNGLLKPQIITLENPSELMKHIRDFFEFFNFY